MKMSATLVTVLAIVGVFFLGIFVFLGMYVSAGNEGVSREAGIKASYKNSQNVLGQYEPRIKDALGVTKFQTNAVRDIITGANTARYGENGSQAAVQLIKEENPTLDQSNYGKIIALIEAGRNDFQNKQTETIDKIQAYDVALGTMPKSFFMRMAGYPSPAYLAERDNYERIVKSSHADKAFKTGIDDGVNFNGL